MADTAAHLVDHVFPVVPVRQWVLSSPFALRYKMAYDARLMSDVLNIFARAVLGHLRRRARKFLGLRDSQSGAVTFIQRFGDALNCNVHFHLLAIDGVYTRSENRNPEFHELPAPEDDEIVEFTTIVATRIEALLERRGIGSGSEDEDALSRDDPGMAALYASSIRGRIAVGSNVGYRVARLGDQIDGDSLDVLQSPCCATVNGFSVHANVSIPAHDRMRLHGTPVRIIGWASAVPIEAPLAQWNDGCDLRTSRFPGETRSPCPGSSRPPREIPRHSGSCSCLACLDYSDGQQQGGIHARSGQSRYFIGVR